MATYSVPVRMEEATHRAAKIAAAREGIYLTHLLHEAVTEWLTRHGHPTGIPLAGTRATS